MSTPSKNNINNKMKNNQMVELKKKLKELEEKVTKLENKNNILEEKLIRLESSNQVISRVNDELSKEIDRIDQYSRRSNLLIKNMFLPEEETQNQLTQKVENFIKKDLKMESAVRDIDKLHRTGKVKTSNGKKSQNVIIKFKSHATRYAVLQQKKKAKNFKLCPNLTRKRGKLWYDATQIVDSIPGIDFVFADIHGDMKMRLKNERDDGKIVFQFETLNELNDLIVSLGIAC